MRVLCVHSGGAFLRGSELALLDLVTTAQRLGHDIQLLCDQGILRDKAIESGVQADLIPRGEIMIDPPDYRLDALGLIRSNLQLRREIRVRQPDVLYCNGGRALQMSLVAARAKLPVVVHLHAPYPKRYLILYGITRADLVIHCSENIRAVHETKAKFRRSVALRNAVDETRFPPVAELKRPDGVPVIGFIGSLIHRKGVDILIRAVHQLQTRGIACRLRMAGTERDGVYRKLTDELGVRCEFVGEVKRDQVADFFSGIHIHALPTRGDAMPLTIIEAAYAGVPSIATTVGGVSESMLGGKLGVLYDTNTPDELANRLAWMLKSEWMSKEKSTEIARLSRKEFSLVANARTLVDLFESTIRPAGQMIASTD